MKKYPLLIFFFLSHISASSSAQEIDQLQQQVSNALQESVKTQGSIDSLSSELQQTTKHFQNLERQLKRANNSNQTLETLLAKKAQQRVLLQEQLQSISDTGHQIQPLMLKMQRSLVELIQADLPFMQQQRLANASQLAIDLDSSEIGLAEKYRQLVQGFLTEAGYGRELKSYQGELEVMGESREVVFLRLGRIALYYQTLDKQYAGLYSTQSRQWQTLSAAAAKKLATALRVVNGSTQPALLSLPLLPIEDKNE